MKGSKGEKGEGTGLLLLLSLAFWYQSYLRPGPKSPSTHTAQLTEPRSLWSELQPGVSKCRGGALGLFGFELPVTSGPTLEVGTSLWFGWSLLLSVNVFFLMPV